MTICRGSGALIAASDTSGVAAPYASTSSSSTRLGAARPERVLFRKKVGVRRLGSVKQRLASHHELLHARAAAGVEHVHGADAFELVCPGTRVCRRGEKRKVDERVHALERDDPVLRWQEFAAASKGQQRQQHPDGGLA